jgi:hypothetical protein
MLEDGAPWQCAAEGHRCEFCVASCLVPDQSPCRWTCIRGPPLLSYLACIVDQLLPSWGHRTVCGCCLLPEAECVLGSLCLLQCIWRT